MTMRRARWLAGPACVCALGVIPPAAAADFPEFIDYVLKADSSLQRLSNPFRVSDAERGFYGPDTVRLNEISGAVIVPLLSDRTRFVASGSFGSAVYDRHPQLTHQPKRLDTAFQWRAGRLFQGSVGLGQEERLNRFLSLSAPDRDLVDSRNVFADVGLRVTESLTLPQLSVSRNSLRYEYPLNATLYNRNENRVQVAARYSGWGASYVQAGLMQSRVDYIDRTPGLIAQVDNRYADREAFVDAQWVYSAKTMLSSRIGYRQRSYETLTDRNTSLITVDAKAAWQYSPKTRFDVAVWHRPYANEEDPGILYSTLTGARASIRWQYTDKLWLSFNVVRENQKNTRLAAINDGSSEALRFGPRVEWAVTRNMKLTVDGWQDKVEGRNYPSSTSTVVRVGLTLMTENGGAGQPERLLRSPDCAPPRYVETTLCYD
ncbi:hypothetical protein [Pigmentiphaga litoralis]|uniref:Exopolysaccharide biosynthesis operon protein EpsL n=1 Tax=Pigmentiphaga litoralis TaxID=516702 RepID=A0A7Y9LQ55_9BURK|nr:hypothetical protein [Pigmentiphaga litoralis]NYE26395.1 hypothetical protein [Pigmentiphaga litoralis]NYE85515.1 hypothetical protein [Pigmentiphaga litoralis]